MLVGSLTYTCACGTYCTALLCLTVNMHLRTYVCMYHYIIHLLKQFINISGIGDHLSNSACTAGTGGDISGSANFVS